MNEKQLRQKLYESISEAIKGKTKIGVAWSGGPNSGLIIGILKELGHNPVVIYADDMIQKPEFYLYLQQARKKYDLNLVRPEFKSDEDKWESVLQRTAKEQKVDILLTGNDLDFGVNPLVGDDNLRWNIVKTYHYPYYRVSKSMLG